MQLIGVLRQDQYKIETVFLDDFEVNFIRRRKDDVFERRVVLSVGVDATVRLVLRLTGNFVCQHFFDTRPANFLYFS